MNRGKEFTQNYIKQAESDMSYGNQSVGGIKTGILGWDFATGGMHKGDLVVIGGRPSMGKTSFALRVVEHVVLEENKTCIYITTHDSGHVIARRLLSSVSLVPQRYTKERTKDELLRIKEAARRIRHSELIIEEIPAATISQIEDVCNNSIWENHADIIVVDNLQGIYSDDYKNDNESRKAIVKKLKKIVEMNNCIVLLLSSVSRATEDREYHRPTLADICCFGDIGRYADQILLLYREAYYDKEKSDSEKAEVFIAKSKISSNHWFEMRFIGKYQRFEMDHELL